MPDHPDFPAPAYPASAYPTLAYLDWADSKDSLHLFLQIIGKVRLKAHPKLNHWWHVTLYPVPRGLTTGRIPQGSSGFEIRYDLLEHGVRVTRDDGREVAFPVVGKTVAAFHETLFAALAELGFRVAILARPYENKSTTPFAEDRAPRAYDPAAVTRYWQALCGIQGIFERWRGRFVGKQTPVHLFWHSFDLVVTRFSGHAHPLEGARTQSDREAYSHEVISVGFWPGDDSFPEAAFYGYAYPEPEGLGTTGLRPAEAGWSEKNGGALAIYRYDDFRASADPAGELLAFLESVYQAAGTKAAWPLEELRHRYL